ncbi:protein of unknown function [Xenorhabdus nematophila AN6/1]|nr:hypothetical protein XNW1_20004 [Xenorhabdus nematophila str. Websteri]CEK21056.1 protein of unknown function [Xenorhabdus nematophila AN6/1]
MAVNSSCHISSCLKYVKLTPCEQRIYYSELIANENDY